MSARQVPAWVARDSDPSRAACVGDPEARAESRSAGWLQLVKFCSVGAIGYAVNLGAYSLFLFAGFGYVAAAVVAFTVAVTHNYTLNRLWTFRSQRGQAVTQGLRFLGVSIAVLGLNLALLALLVGIHVGEVPAQAAATLLVAPIAFLANKHWSFDRPSGVSA